MQILEDHSLKLLNTLAIDVKARYFCEANSLEDIQKACLTAKEFGIPFIPLGEGSNVIFANDLNALVVKVSNKGTEIVAENQNYVWIKVAAGEQWHSLVAWCLKNKLYGLENLALIPGTAGAAPIQNIGAYGVEVSDCFSQLSAIDLDTQVVVIFDKEKCGFGYRESNFKHALKDRYVITDLTFCLNKQPSTKANYAALKEYLADSVDKPTPDDIFNAVVQIRQSKLPDPKFVPNAGSFFKNPVISAESYKNLVDLHPGIMAYKLSDNSYKIAAGWLIDKASWKGKMIDGVCVHEQQALVLTNPERQATAKSILNFAHKVAQDIYKKFGIRLEIEPRVLS